MCPNEDSKQALKFPRRIRGGVIDGRAGPTQPPWTHRDDGRHHRDKNRMWHRKEADGVRYSRSHIIMRQPLE